MHGVTASRDSIRCHGLVSDEEAAETCLCAELAGFATASKALFTILFFLAILCAVAADPAHGETAEGRRAALVIGNSAYESLNPLPNAVNDARRIGDVLTKANFEVTVGTDLTKVELEESVRNFLRSLNDGDVALFYYSGHAVQVAGQNFILPVDASLSSSYDLELESYSISNLLDYMRETTSLQILVLDACRNNPFRNETYYLGDKKVDVEDKDGLASLVPRRGSLIVYSTAPDQVAYDGTGNVSPFTDSLSQHVLTPNVEVRELLTDIRADVIARTSGRQVPWDVSSLTSQFYFVRRQDMLVMDDSLTEMRVSPASRKVKLDIPRPIASGDMTLTASFGKAPKHGKLMLDGKPVEPGAAIGADRLSDVVYVTEPGQKTVDLIPYSVASNTGQKVSGAVALVFDPALEQAGKKPALSIGAAETQEAGDRTADADSKGADRKAEPAGPVQLVLATDVGTGFVTVSDAMPRESGLRAGWYRLEERAPSTQVALDARMLSEGDLVKGEDITRLAVRPALRIIDTDAKIVLQPASDSSAEAPVVINVSADVHRCDRLAGDRLDIQGVVEGVYPNEIKLDEADSACREAVERFPDVARFKYEYGRVLYANGDYAQAIRNFQGALDAGHVRAGYLIGRLYQLGGPLGRDPSRAIPLFEAGAKRGDPYAQHALGRALVEGFGTKPDTARGVELLTRAAEAGHTFAMNALGTEYLYGEHIDKNIERAARFFRESAKRDDVYGLLNLGVLYRDGVGVAQDKARAMELFKKADAGGHPRAGTVIALLLRANGDADQSDLLGWFRKSAERGDAWGAFHAANILRDNPDLQKTDGERIRLLALSASHRTPDVSARAEQQLSGMDSHALTREIQKALERMGEDVGAVDGLMGPQTREGVNAVLGSSPPQNPPKMLMELLRKEWLDSRPRLDMLG